MLYQLILISLIKDIAFLRATIALSHLKCHDIDIFTTYSDSSSNLLFIDIGLPCVGMAYCKIYHLAFVLKNQKLYILYVSPTSCQRMPTKCHLPSPYGSQKHLESLNLKRSREGGITHWMRLQVVGRRKPRVCDWGYPASNNG